MLGKGWIECPAQMAARYEMEALDKCKIFVASRILDMPFRLKIPRRRSILLNMEKCFLIERFSCDKYMLCKKI